MSSPGFTSPCVQYWINPDITYVVRVYSVVYACHLLLTQFNMFLSEYLCGSKCHLTLLLRGLGSLVLWLKAGDFPELIA